MTQSKKQRNHKYPKKKVPTSKEIEPGTINSIDKSRYSQRTNLSNKSTRIEKTSEIDIHRDNLSVSVFYGQGESSSRVTPDIFRIPRKNKRKITPDTLIIIKKILKNQSTQGKGQTE